MKAKLELATVVRQLQSAKEMQTNDRIRLLQKAAACTTETDLLAVQNEAFALQGGAVGAKQNKMAAVADTR